jgi:hypothetical protein
LVVQSEKAQGIDVSYQFQKRSLFLFPHTADLILREASFLMDLLVLLIADAADLVLMEASFLIDLPVLLIRDQEYCQGERM